MLDDVSSLTWGDLTLPSAISHSLLNARGGEGGWDQVVLSHIAKTPTDSSIEVF